MLDPQEADRRSVSCDRLGRQVLDDRPCRSRQIQRVTRRRVSSVHQNAARIGQGCRQIEGVITIQTTQFQKIDSTRIQRHRHEPARRIHNLNPVGNGVHVEDITVSRAVELQHIFTPTGTGKADRAKRSQMLERQRHSCGPRTRTTSRNRSRVSRTARSVGHLIDTCRGRMRQRVSPACTVYRHAFDRRKVHDGGRIYRH